MYFQQQKLLLFSFTFLWEMRLHIEAKLTDYEERPYRKLIRIPKQLNVLFQLLHRLLLRMNKRRNVKLLFHKRTNLKLLTPNSKRIIH
jgi:hypothetical protein